MSDDLQKWEFERDRYQIEQIRTTLTLTSGTIIVSFGIVATKTQLTYMIFLYISWISLVISIILGIKALTAGISRYDRAAKGQKGELKGKEKALYEKGKVLTPFEAKTPSIQIWSFTIGLINFLIFVVINWVLPLSKKPLLNC